MVTVMRKKFTAVRLPLDTLERVDAYGQRLRREQPGLDVNQAVALRLLIAKGLEAVEEKPKKKH